MDDARSDRNINGSMGDVVTYAIEYPAELRDLSGHPRELPISRVDDFGKDEEDEGTQAWAFFVEQGASGDASDRAQNTEMRWPQCHDACSLRNDPAARPEKEDV